MMTPIGQINGLPLYCAIAGLYLSSICDKKVLLFHQNNNFDYVKKKKKSIYRDSFWKSSEQCYFHFPGSGYDYWLDALVEVSQLE